MLKSQLPSYGLSLYHPQNPSVEILTPSVMVFGGGAFGRCLGQEDGAPVTGSVP